MSPAKKISAISDLYTAILALATGVVLTTAVFVAVRCHIDYGMMFKIFQSTR